MRVKKESKIKEMKEKLNESRKVRITIMLTKLTLYIVCIIASFKYSVIIANNIIFGLQQIVNWGVDNMTKLVFGVVTAIITIIMFRK